MYQSLIAYCSDLCSLNKLNCKLNGVNYTSQWTAVCLFMMHVQYISVLALNKEKEIFYNDKNNKTKLLFVRTHINLLLNVTEDFHSSYIALIMKIYCVSLF